MQHSVGSPTPVIRHVVAIFTPEVDPRPLWVLNLQNYKKNTMLFPT